MKSENWELRVDSQKKQPIQYTRGDVLGNARSEISRLQGELSRHKGHGPKEDYNQPGGPKEDYYQPEWWDKIETRRTTQEAENLKKWVGPATGEYIYGKNGEIITKHLTALETAQQNIIRGGTTPASMQYPQDSGVNIGYNHVDGSDILSLQGKLAQKTDTKYVDFNSFFQGGIINFQTPNGDATNGFVRTGLEAKTHDFKIGDNFSARAYMSGEMLALMTKNNVSLDASWKVGGVIAFTDGKWKFSVDGGSSYELAPSQVTNGKMTVNHAWEYIIGNIDHQGDSLRTKVSAGVEEYFDSKITSGSITTGGDKYQFGIGTQYNNSNHPSIMPTSQAGAIFNANITKNTSIGLELGQQKRGDDSDGYANLSVNTKW